MYSPGERVAENGPDGTAAANHRPVESAHYASVRRRGGTIIGKPLFEDNA